MIPKAEDEICSYKGCNLKGKWIRVRPSSMVTFEVLACEGHGKLLD